MTTTPAVRSRSSAAVAVARRRVAVRTRLLLGGAGVGLLAAAWWLDGWSWALVAFALLPDVPLFLAFGHGLERGQPHPRAVPFYNATHRIVGPVLLTGAGLVLQSGGGSASALVAGLAWSAHILVDRASGYGLRRADGWQR